MGRQAKAKQRRREEAALENAMGVVDECLVDAGIAWYVLNKFTGHLDEFFLIYYDQYIDGKELVGWVSLDEALAALKRVVIGDLKHWAVSEGDSPLKMVRIPVSQVQAGGITVRDTWYLEIDPNVDDAAQEAK